MSKIYFWSDQHFSHENILKFKDDKGNLIRSQFSSVEEMDDVMIQNYNKVVKPQDKVYFLGDVCFKQNKFDSIMSKLNGNKRLILGNHDTFQMTRYMKHFQKISSWRKFGKDFKYNFVCCHYPLHINELEKNRDKDIFMVHGHIHQNIIPHNKYINVCVEHLNYSPIELEELYMIMELRSAYPSF